MRKNPIVNNTYAECTKSGRDTLRCETTFQSIFSHFQLYETV